MNIYWSIIISLIFSAFFSGMEIAFVSSNRLRFELNKRSNRFTGPIVGYFNRHSDQFISTMLVGNNIALVIYGIRMAQLLEPIIARWIPSDFVITVIQTLIATLIVLFTGEFLPKTIFRHNPNVWISVFSPLLFVCYVVLYPVTLFCTYIAILVMRLFKVYTPNKEKQAIGKMDLDFFINESIESGNENKEIENDVRIFQNALDFNTIKLRDCIIPRTEITALPKDATTLEELTNEFVEDRKSVE